MQPEKENAHTEANLRHNQAAAEAMETDDAGEDKEDKQEERATMEEKEWEKEEADLEEGEEHNVLPMDSDGEEDSCETDESFEGYLRKMDRDHSYYLTNIVLGTCSCPDRVVVGFICKHLFRALQNAGKDINSLPKSVTEAPHISVDREILRRDRNVMEDVVQSCSDDEDEEANHWHTGLGVGGQEDFGPCEAEPTNQTATPTPAANPPQVGTREAESALNSFLGHMKLMTSLAHKGTLPGEAILKYEKVARSLRDEMVGSDKIAIDGASDFAQVGNRRNRKVGTEHGISCDHTLKRKIKSSENEESNFKKVKGKGRPKKDNSALPKYAKGGVNWGQISRMPSKKKKQ